MFYNVQQQALICLIPHTVIISTYTAYLMVSARPAQGLLREELRMRLSANHKDWWSRVVVWLPRSQADSPYHHCTQGINHHHYHHLTKGGIHAQEVSCIANGCSYSTTAHALAMCSPLPASVAEHMRRTPRSHISSSLTPQRHMSLTDRPSVCFPLQDEVHFLCSLCFRP